MVVLRCRSASRQLCQRGIRLQPKFLYLALQSLNSLNLKQPIPRQSVNHVVNSVMLVLFKLATSIR